MLLLSGMLDLAPSTLFIARQLVRGNDTLNTSVGHTKLDVDGRPTPVITLPDQLRLITLAGFCINQGQIIHMQCECVYGDIYSHWIHHQCEFLEVTLNLTS